MKQIFMGNGPHTAAACYALHQNLELALNILGGIQQPCHHTENVPCYCLEEAEAAQRRVDFIAESIYGALTGREVSHA